MTGLLRWLLGLWAAQAAPTTGPAPALTPEPPTETTPTPQWQHGPDKPRGRAEMCGELACDNPVGDHESGEFCSAKCQAAWITGFCNPVSMHNTDPFPVPDISPAPPPEPVWMAGWTGWEKRKAEVFIEARKSPKTGEAA